MEPQDVSPRTAPTSSLGIPIAIIIGFGMIAAAIYFSGLGTTAAPQQAIDIDTTPTEEPVTPESIPPVTEADHIRGNPNAPIMLVEYSDYDCPFCKLFHETMNRIIEKYGPTGDVAWVYRHLPLTQLHPNAVGIAVAAECVSELGGNEAFWTFSDAVFANRGTNDPTNMTQLPAFAEQAGIDRTAFEECLASGRHVEKVQAQSDGAIKAGARGTPHTFLIVGDQQGVINGAQPFETVDRIVSNVIGQIGGQAPEAGE